MKTDRSSRGWLYVDDAVGALTAAAARVCRIVFDRGTRRERAVATAFLASPDRLVTAAHVWPSVRAGRTRRDAIACVFADGEVRPLARDWLITIDDALDVSVVQLASAMNPQRGWLEVPRFAPMLARDSAVYVVQWPAGERPSVTAGVVRRADATRIVYTASTMGSSSGAPVFDARMRLTAMHRGATADHANEGVLLSPLARELYGRASSDRFRE